LGDVRLHGAHHAKPFCVTWKTDNHPPISTHGGACERALQNEMPGTSSLLP
jgi:hypothetical protein